ncbi:Unknown protein sequence [Pseudomonas coronafaciens pv. oryzae]|nr:Unknown protein sequence [Pseudomonas coronafaciens pv. oryzae]
MSFQQLLYLFTAIHIDLLGVQVAQWYQLEYRCRANALNGFA